LTRLVAQACKLGELLDDDVVEELDPELGVDELDLDERDELPELVELEFEEEVPLLLLLVDRSSLRRSSLRRSSLLRERLLRQSPRPRSPYRLR
jgi:hypothetical protein